MKSVLYLGIDLPKQYQRKTVIHYPIIKIVPHPIDHVKIIHAYKEFSQYTHLIFTSKSAVGIFFDYARAFGVSIDEIQNKCLIAVGKATEETLRQRGVCTSLVARDETAEGLVFELERRQNLDAAYFFWPHSALSRPVLLDFFRQRKLRYYDCVFYETVPNFALPLPNLTLCEEIVFTSPSTVDAFLLIFGKIPGDKILTCIGPITEKKLNTRITNPRSTFSTDA
jgi:uroporphyrinogen-III synthase